MDVVYFVRENKNNQELRYSLRSLSNINKLHNGKVRIFGHKPKRCVNVQHIEMTDHNHRYKNVIDKYVRLLETPVTNNFIFMHDDMYVMRELDDIPYYYRDTLQGHIDIIQSAFNKNEYYKSLNAVRKVFPEGYSYDVHTPIIYNKRKLKAIFKKYPPGTRGSKRSLYCNTYCQGVQYPTKDCKWYKIGNWTCGDFLSTGDMIGNSHMFKSYISDIFPHKSIYEI